MKKLLFLLSFTASVLFSGCVKDSQIEVLERDHLLTPRTTYSPTEGVNATSLDATTYVSDVITWLSNNGFPTCIDTTNSYYYEYADSLETPNQIYVEFNSSSNDTLLMLTIQGDTISGAMYTTHDYNSSTDLTTIELINLSKNQVVTAEIDPTSETISIFYTGPTAGIYDPCLKCGEYVAQCMSEWYTEHGWTSVLLWVGSAFDPRLAASVAIGCAAACFIHNHQNNC